MAHPNGTWGLGVRILILNIINLKPISGYHRILSMSIRHIDFLVKNLGLSWLLSTLQFLPEKLIEYMGWGHQTPIWTEC